MNNQKIAVTLHFLIQGFWNHAEEYKRLDDILDGIGEDDFVNDCYEIATAIENLNEAVSKDKECAGVYMYEVIEDIGGKILFDYIRIHLTQPSVLEFIGRFKPAIEKWYTPKGFYKVEPHKMHTLDRYKLSMWDGERWGFSFHYTVQEAEDIAEQVKAELLNNG